MLTQTPTDIKTIQYSNCLNVIIILTVLFDMEITWNMFPTVSSKINSNYRH